MIEILVWSSSADGNLSEGWLIEANQHIQKGRFSAAGLADDSDHFASMYIEVQPVDGDDRIGSLVVGRSFADRTLQCRWSSVIRASATRAPRCAKGYPRRRIK